MNTLFLINACIKNDTQAVLNKLLTEPNFLREIQNPMINAIKDSDGSDGIIPILKLLLHFGADVNEKHNNETVLTKCCLMHGQTEVLKFLLDNKADHSSLPTIDPLFVATHFKKREFIRVLLQYGAVPTQSTVVSGGKECFDLFLKYGYIPTTCTDFTMISNSFKCFHILYGDMDPKTKFEDIPYIKYIYMDMYLYHLNSLGPLTSYLVNKFESFLKPPSSFKMSRYWRFICPSYIEKLYEGVDRKTKFEEIPYIEYVCYNDDKKTFDFMAEQFDFFFKPPDGFNVASYWTHVCTGGISFLKRLYKDVDRKTKFEKIPYIRNVLQRNFKGMFSWLVDRFDCFLQPYPGFPIPHYWDRVFCNINFTIKVFENIPLNSLNDIPYIERVNFRNLPIFNFFAGRGCFERTPPVSCVKLFIKTSKTVKILRIILKNFIRLGKEIGDLEQYLPLRLSMVKVLVKCGATTNRFNVNEPQEIEEAGYCNICYTDRDKFKQCLQCKNSICLDCVGRVIKCPFCREPLGGGFMNQNEIVYPRNLNHYLTN
jgi:hypothetical protein